MRATSIIDSSLKSKNSYIVLHYGDESLILGLNHIHRFSSISSLAAKEWDLQEDCITVETNELDICRGQYSRVHEDTWEDIKDIIGNVRIKVKAAGKTSTNLLSVQGLATPRVSRHVVRRDTSESDEESEVEHQTKSDSDSGRFVVVPESDATEPPRTPLTGFSRESSTAVEDAVNESTGDSLGLFGDALEQEPSPVDAEFTISESELNTAVPTRETMAQNLSGDSELRQGQQKQQDAQLPSSSRAASQPQDEDMSTASVPERVTVAIEAPYLDIEPISFSVRYKHSVLAVLRGACKKHFLIDHHRACLQMAATDAKGKTCYIPCDSKATMESLGVVDNQTFVLLMNEDDEEEESE